jgi:hypothetical protein
MNAPRGTVEPEGTYSAPLHGWTCFHCGETFSIAECGSLAAAERAAREHFGPDPRWSPECVELLKTRPRKLYRRLRLAQTRLADLEGREEELDHLRSVALDVHDLRCQVDSLEGRALAAEERAARLEALINTPELEDFLAGVRLEAAHQVERWGESHDRSKSAENWYWLLGYLAGKALRAAIIGDRAKALHHCVSSAAALLNWHRAIAADTSGAGVGRDEDLQVLG